jgi:hypothetical protein
VDTQALHILAMLIRTLRIAALGTLRNGAPEVSITQFAASVEGTAFYIHISRLAHHTQNIARDSRVSLLLSESDDGTRNPQTLARVSIQGDAVLMNEASGEYESARTAYITKFPFAAMNFSLGDFGLYKIEPHAARFVANFGQIYNLTLDDFKQAGAQWA